jgi:serine/threonine protein phosphatase PrpC
VRSVDGGTAKNARLYAGRDLAEGELHPVGLGLAAIFTAKAPTGDGTNEDACAILPFSDKSGIVVVADGAGGLPGGDRASSLAIAALRSTLRATAKRGGELRGAILDGFDKAHKDVLALGIGAGTTLAVAEISGSKVRTYHAGDSQIIVVGQKGKVKLYTKSHSPVGYALEAGLITDNEALMHAERHLVSNLIGQPMMHIEVGPVVDLSPNDTVIVASDGVFDNLRTEEIVETCRKGTLLAITSSLVDQCRARMASAKNGEPSKPDDLTFVAYRRRVTA